MRTLDVERFHGVSVGERLTRGSQIAEGREHVVGRAGDYRWIEARDAGRESRVDGPLNFAMRRSGRVEIDTGKTIDLKIDETGGDESFRVAGILQYWIDILNRRFERNFDRLTGYRAAPATFHRQSDLYTAYPQ